MKNTTKNKHGGARANAGRKPRPYPRVAITVSVEPEIAEKFKSDCKAENVSQSKRFSALVEK